MRIRRTVPSIVILGGSNSLLTDGWVDRLKAIHPNSDGILNLSIGAATTAMGLYRLLSCTELPEDPVIVWEYALNESNYFTRLRSSAAMLHHLEWLLELCARRSYRVLPLIMHNRSEAGANEDNAYRRRLAETLAAHRLIPLDLRQFWREGFSHLDTSTLYKDEPHYSTATGFLPAVADAVMAQADRARVPDGAARTRQRFADRDLKLVCPDGAGGTQFKNRLMTCDIHPLSSPLRFTATGRLLACFLISSRSEPAIMFRSGGTEIGPFSAQINPDGRLRAKQLKHLLLWSEDRPPLDIGSTLDVTPTRMEGVKPVVQHTMSWQEPAEGDIGEGGMIGVMLETGR